MKQISRRTLLQMAASALLLAQISACSSGKDVLSEEEILAGLTRLARDLFPHQSVSEDKYAAIARYFMEQDYSVASQIIEDMGDGEPFARLSDKARLIRIREMINAPGSQAFRFAVLVGLYSDLSVTKIFGYQGPSLNDHGYIERGFNDLDWLPDPPVGDPKEGVVA